MNIGVNVPIPIANAQNVWFIFLVDISFLSYILHCPGQSDIEHMSSVNLHIPVTSLNVSNSLLTGFIHRWRHVYHFPDHAGCSRHASHKQSRCGTSMIYQRNGLKTDSPNHKTNPCRLLKYFRGLIYFQQSIEITLISGYEWHVEMSFSSFALITSALLTKKSHTFFCVFNWKHD